MFDLEDGWLVQPGKTKGVRWLVQEDISGGPWGFRLMTDSAMVLLAGEHIRAVHGYVFYAGKDLSMNQLNVSMAMVVVDGIIQFRVGPQVGTGAAVETRDLYPGHGVVIPRGQRFGMRPMVRSVLVAMADSEELA